MAGMVPSVAQDPLTLPYKTIDGSPILLDVYRPRATKNNLDQPLAVPSVVYFHGGGLTVGNRKSWFPHWLEERVTAAGMLFISADYRLLPPSTGHDIVQDIKDLFHFLASDLNAALLAQLDKDPTTGSPLTIDPYRITVAGNSAGGLCAYLAVMHANPKPKSLVAMYAMGGNFFIPHYIVPKSTVFFRGRELLDPQSFAQYLYPHCYDLQPLSDSPLAYHSADAPIPGYPANPRMLLARLYLQMGIFLDFYAGIRDLSLELRQILSSSTASHPPEAELAQRFQSALPLFPQLAVTTSWPPTFLVHGAQDTAVPVEESSHMFHRLESIGVPVTLRVVPDKEHSFDYAVDAETEFGQDGGLFDEVQRFILEHSRQALDKSLV